MFLMALMAAVAEKVYIGDQAAFITLRRVIEYLMEAERLFICDFSGTVWLEFKHKLGTSSVSVICL